MKKPKLSVALVTRNEEERLRACLESVAWADEIVVVDAESDDKTATIAREFTDRVVVRPWPGYAAQKNTALDLATGDWTLSLDADEIVSAELSTLSRDVRTNIPQEQLYLLTINFRWKDLRSGRILLERRNFQQTAEFYPTLGEGEFVGSQNSIEKLALAIVQEMQADW